MENEYPENEERETIGKRPLMDRPVAQRRRWIALVILAICCGAGLGVYYYLFHPGTGQKQTGPELTAVQKLPEAAVQKPVEETPPAASTELKQSDESFGQAAKSLSSHPQFAEWLPPRDMIRRITAAVVSVAEGQSPKAHLNFPPPEKRFSVIKKGDQLFLDPKSYDRYNLLATVIASLDVEGSVRVYKNFYNLFQSSYRELGYREGDFQDVLFRALKVILRVPVVEGDIEVEEGLLSYRLADERLEGLNELQKHFIRLGPQNTRQIQDKLREFALALGMREKDLPKPEKLSPVAK